MGSVCRIDGSWEQFDIEFIRIIKDLIETAIDQLNLSVSNSSFSSLFFLIFQSFLVYPWFSWFGSLMIYPLDVE
jgi:hypothetical protein